MDDGCRLARVHDLHWHVQHDTVPDHDQRANPVTSRRLGSTDRYVVPATAGWEIATVPSGPTFTIERELLPYWEATPGRFCSGAMAGVSVPDFNDGTVDHKILTVQECKAECLNTADCDLINHNGADNRCYLRGIDDATFAGVSACSASSSDFTGTTTGKRRLPAV